MHICGSFLEHIYGINILIKFFLIVTTTNLVGWTSLDLDDKGLSPRVQDYM